MFKKVKHGLLVDKKCIADIGFYWTQYRVEAGDRKAGNENIE